MRICIPVEGTARGNEERVYGHFGSAPNFAVVDTAEGTVEFLANANGHHEHGACNPVGAVAGKAVEAVVTGGMGRRAVELLNASGIRVFRTDAETVREVVNAFAAGEIEELTADAACGGHGCH